MDEIQRLQDRFGKDGMKELAQLDNLNMALLYRLYLVSTIAKNLAEFNPELGHQFYNSQTFAINTMLEDLDKMTSAFQDKRGEI